MSYVERQLQVYDSFGSDFRKSLFMKFVVKVCQCPDNEKRDKTMVDFHIKGGRSVSYGKMGLLIL